MDTEGVVPLTNNSNLSSKMNNSIDLYYFPASPPSRAVMLVARTVGVKLNLKLVNIMEGGHLAPEFLKINPQHTVPVLVDNDLILTESRAIMIYLVTQYGKDDTLISKKPKHAAVVHQRLFFDACTLYQRLIEYYVPVAFLGLAPDEVKAAKFEEALGWLDGFLENGPWVAGQNITIADYSIVSTISTAEAVLFDISKYPNIVVWYEKAKMAIAPHGYDEINQVGANMIGEAFKSKLN